MNNLLDIKDLTVFYDSVKALDKFSFAFNKGSICAFIGSNGAGKTTTFSVISGFIYPESGGVLIDGKSLKEFRKQGGLIGLLPQDVSFYENRTINSQFVFLARLSGLTKEQAKQEVDWALSTVGLEDKKDFYPQALSHGMKVRLGIAQAILGHPKLVLLDEPTAGLDPLRREQFYELINSLKDEISFIISSHQLGELEKLCDYICMIEKGKLLVAKSMKEFLTSSLKIDYEIGKYEGIKESFTQKFPDLKVNFNELRTSFSVEAGGESLREINSKILGWLLTKDIDILKVSRQASLNDKYLEQLVEQK